MTPMTFEKIVFYVLAALLIFAATMVITRRNPVQLGRCF